jgi:uncharacterized protein YkwD
VQLQRPARKPRAPARLLLASALLVGCLGDVNLEDGFPGRVGSPSAVDPNLLGGSADGGGPVSMDGGFVTGLWPDAGALPTDGASAPPSAVPSPATPDAQVSAPDAQAPDAGASVPDAGAPASSDVPDIAACADARSWPDNPSQYEREVFELTNQARAAGHNCDSEGSFGPAPALTMEPHLRCSARLHSAYMARTGDFNHTQTATGLDPFERIAATGYRARAAGENIAAGQTSPRSVVDGWLESDGHCRNIMDPGYTEIGVGYVLGTIGYKHYWTQNFGKPM